MERIVINWVKLFLIRSMLAQSEIDPTSILLSFRKLTHQFWKAESPGQASPA